MRIARAALVVLLAAQSASAGFWDGGKPNIKIGQLELHPYYGLTTTYDDNIYLVPKNENDHAVAGGGVRGSWIITNNAGLGLNLPIGGMHRLSANYDARHDAYKTQSSANNAFHQKVDVGYDFKGANVNARVFDNYMNTQDPQFNPNHTVVAGELVDREQRWQNTAGASAEYSLGDKFFFGGDAQDTVHKYVSPALGAILNRSEALFGIKTGYKIQPKTRVYVAAHRQLVHYNAGTEAQHVANHRDWLADFGIEGELAAKVKGQIQTGFGYREHDRDNAAARRESVSRTWTASTRVNYQPTERCDFTLTANRATNDAVSGGNYYTTNGVAVDAGHKYNKFRGWIRGGAQWDKYSETQLLGGITAQRRDDTYKAGLGLDYDIQEWLKTGVAFEGARRFSTFSRQFNYRDNRTSWNVKVVF